MYIYICTFSCGYMLLMDQAPHSHKKDDAVIPKLWDLWTSCRTLPLIFNHVWKQQARTYQPEPKSMLPRIYLVFTFQKSSQEAFCNSGYTLQHGSCAIGDVQLPPGKRLSSWASGTGCPRSPTQSWALLYNQLKRSHETVQTLCCTHRGR